jgi:hypothetical protein
MLDVHPPHEPAHSWREFFVHMATICLGLLIAIGLEQSVEWLHHRRELKELREGLREDGERALSDTDGLKAAMNARIHWLSVRGEQVQAALDEHKALAVPPPTNFPDFEVPNDPAWKAAKASGLTALVAPEDIKAYSEIDDVTGEVFRNFQVWDAQATKREAFEWRFSRRGTSGALDFSKASPEDLQAYLAVLADEAAAAHQIAAFSCFWLHESQRLVLAGERDIKKINDAEGASPEGAAPPTEK